MTKPTLPPQLSKKFEENGARIIEIARKYGIFELDLLKAMDEVNALPKVEMTKRTKRDWEQEFDEFIKTIKIESIIVHEELSSVEVSKDYPDQIKQFLAQSLQDQREQMMGEVEEMRKSDVGVVNDWGDSDYGEHYGYNQALDDVLTKLRKE